MFSSESASLSSAVSTFLDTLEVNTGACVTVAHIINAVYRKLAVHCTVPLSALRAVDSFIARICLFKERIMVPSAVAAAVTEPQQRGLSAYTLNADSLISIEIDVDI